MLMPVVLRFFGHVSLRWPHEKSAPRWGGLAFQEHLSERGSKGVLRRVNPQERRRRSVGNKIPREEKVVAPVGQGVEEATRVVGDERTLIHVCERGSR